MPAFALPSTPAVLTVDLHCWRNAPLPPPGARRRLTIRSFGIRLEPRWIFGAESLDQWAITHSLNDGCFWANILVVWATPHPSPLSLNFGTLAVGLDCFPFARIYYSSLKLNTLAPSSLLFLCLLLSVAHHYNVKNATNLWYVFSNNCWTKKLPYSKRIVFRHLKTNILLSRSLTSYTILLLLLLLIIVVVTLRTKKVTVISLIIPLQKRLMITKQLSTKNFFKPLSPNQPEPLYTTGWVKTLFIKRIGITHPRFRKNKQNVMILTCHPKCFLGCWGCREVSCLLDCLLLALTGFRSNQDLIATPFSKSVHQMIHRYLHILLV